MDIRLKVFLWFFMLCSILWHSASGQERFLQLEKTTSFKVRKIYPGSELTFQLNNGLWYNRVLEDVSYESNRLIFAENSLPLDSIVAIRSYRNANWSRPLGNQLVNFGIAWTGFNLIAALATDEEQFTNFDVGVAVGSAALGLSLKRLFRYRTFRIKRNAEGNPVKWRLRILDLRLHEN